MTRRTQRSSRFVRRIVVGWEKLAVITSTAGEKFFFFLSKCCYNVGFLTEALGAIHSTKIRPVRPGKVVHLKRWTRFLKLFRLDWTDPLSFGPKFPEILVKWIAPFNLYMRRRVTSRCHGSTISGWQQNQRRRRRQGERQKIICLY